MLNKYPKVVDTIASREIEHEVVAVVPEEGLVRVLNETGARIWQLSDGGHKTEDIINIITSEFDISKDKAEEDIVGFICELENKGMLRINDEPHVQQ